MDMFITTEGLICFPAYMDNPWCLYFLPRLCRGRCHVRGKPDLDPFRKAGKEEGRLFLNLLFLTARRLITHKYVKVNGTIKNVMN